MMTAGKAGAGGFTLIELLVTLAVAVILATVAVPGFQNMMARNQMAADVNAMLNGLNYARSEAIKRRNNVSLIVGSGGVSWVVQVKEEGGAPLREIVSSNSRVSLGESKDFSVVFNALGKMASAGDCVGGCGITLSSGDRCREIGVNSLGRVRVEECGE